MSKKIKKKIVNKNKVFYLLLIYAELRSQFYAEQMTSQKRKSINFDRQITFNQH